MYNEIIIRLYKGKGLISSLIKWHTRGEYSHASIIIGGAIYEAKEFVGCRKRLAYDECDYDDFIVLNSTVEQRAIVVEFLERQIGKGYDYVKIFAFITRAKQDRKSLGKFFCSELCYAALSKSGINLFNLTKAWEITPDFLKRSVMLRKLT